MTAKCYTYRNLHRGGFSTKYKGIVRYRFGGKSDEQCGVVVRPDFRVSQISSAKVKNTNSRTVHAYVVSDQLTMTSCSPPDCITSCPYLKYNPRTDTAFSASDQSSLSYVYAIVFCNDQAYIVRQGNIAAQQWIAQVVDQSSIVDNERDILQYQNTIMQKALTRYANDPRISVSLFARKVLDHLMNRRQDTTHGD